MLESFWDFARGVAGRFWFLLPALLLDPFDLADRLFGVAYHPPTSMAWAIFALGLFVASALVYHDLRAQMPAAADLRLEVDGEYKHADPGMALVRIKATNAGSEILHDSGSMLMSIEPNQWSPFLPPLPQSLLWFLNPNPLDGSKQLSISPGASEFINVAFATFDMPRFLGSDEAGRNALLDRSKFQFTIVDPQYQQAAGQYELEIQVTAANAPHIPAFRCRLTYSGGTNLTLKQIGD